MLCKLFIVKLVLVAPNNEIQEKTMNSIYKRLSHAIWHCHYHIVWVPKYRYRILNGVVKEEIENTIRMIAEQQGCEIEELNVQNDHVHVLLMIPPKISLSELVGMLKGKTAIRIFSKIPSLKVKPYWGNHFWARGYCVSTVGLDLEKIRRYVKYQEKNEKALV